MGAMGYSSKRKEHFRIVTEFWFNFRLKLQAELEERKKNRYFFKNPFHQINIRASDLTSSLKE